MVNGLVNAHGQAGGEVADPIRIGLVIDSRRNASGEVKLPVFTDRQARQKLAKGIDHDVMLLVVPAHKKAPDVQNEVLFWKGLEQLDRRMEHLAVPMPVVPHPTLGVRGVGEDCVVGGQSLNLGLGWQRAQALAQARRQKPAKAGSPDQRAGRPTRPSG
ncbi:MAG: hypothetical protein IPO29_06020 [Anaerolineae bacterium]|nr:hypothetical protein [Anaerolineae bacterium]